MHVVNINFIMGNKWLSYQTLHGSNIGLMVHPGGGCS